MDWSPDGNRLATGGDDDMVRIWEAETGLLIATLLPLADGWAVLHDSRRYSYQGTVRGDFWWTVGLARFEIEDLDPYLPEQHRVPEETQMEPPRF